MKKSSPPAPKYAVPALERGLDLLETLSRSAVPRAQSDLAADLGRHSAEIFRMLNCLERRGYIRKEMFSGKYVLTLKLFELAHTHSPLKKQLLSASARPMRELAIRLKESCHLSVLHEGALLVVSQAEGPGRVRLSVEVGRRFTMVHSASGRLLLAQLDPERRVEVLSKDSDYRRLSKPERKRFEAKLRTLREQGYSLAKDETHEGVRDVSVLVGNPRVEVTAALAVAALTPARRPPSDRSLLQAVQACAVEINQALGLSLLG